MEDAARTRTPTNLARVWVAGAALIAAIALAACGSSSGGGSDSGDVPTAEYSPPAEGTLTISTGPLYIDEGAGGVMGEGGTLSNFQQATGLKVNYLEEINSNESTYAKLRPDLENGDSGGRDIIVASDWMAQRYFDQGFAQKLDPEALPVVKENLIPALRNPDFDPEREFTVPWQSGMTGIVVRKDLAPDIDSVNDLFDPKYKGKVTLLEELRDTVPLVMKAEGIDPADASKEQWLETIQKIDDAVKSGQIRDITGNDYIDDVPRGDVVAAIGWSGDAEYMAYENPDIEFVMPAEGCILWSDDMIIPVGAPNPTAAYEFMNYVYEPEHAAQISAYVFYTTPVEGVQPILAKQDPKLGSSQLIFPTEEFTEKCSTQPILSGEDEQEIEEAWARVVAG